MEKARRSPPLFAFRSPSTKICVDPASTKEWMAIITPSTMKPSAKIQTNSIRWLMIHSTTAPAGSLAIGPGVVEGVGRENRRPHGVVAAVDDVVEQVLHELRRFHRSELVEHQQISLQQRPQDLRLAHGGVGIEGGLNVLDEILEIAEQHPPRLAAV